MSKIVEPWGYIQFDMVETVAARLPEEERRAIQQRIQNLMKVHLRLPAWLEALELIERWVAEDEEEAI